MRGRGQESGGGNIRQRVYLQTRPHSVLSFNRPIGWDGQGKERGDGIGASRVKSETGIAGVVTRRKILKLSRPRFGIVSL